MLIPSQKPNKKNKIKKITKQLGFSTASLIFTDEFNA